MAVERLSLWKLFFFDAALHLSVTVNCPYPFLSTTVFFVLGEFFVSPWYNVVPFSGKRIAAVASGPLENVFKKNYEIVVSLRVSFTCCDFGKRTVFVCFLGNLDDKAAVMIPLRAACCGEIYEFSLQANTCVQVAVLQCHTSGISFAGHDPFASFCFFWSKRRN